MSKPKKPSKKARSNPKSPKSEDRKHRDLPATIGFVCEVRDELKADLRSLGHKSDSIDKKIDSVRAELKSEIHGLRSEMHGFKSEMSGIKSEMSGIKSEMSGIKSEIQEVLVAAHRTQALMEEQRADNRVVLEGLKGLNQRQDRVENDFKELKDTLFLLTKTKNSPPNQ